MSRNEADPTINPEHFLKKEDRIDMRTATVSGNINIK